MQRLNSYHRPYHEALAEELDRLKSAHGRVVLYDAHSIRSHVPRLFDDEAAAVQHRHQWRRDLSPELETIVANICAASGKSHVVNGRFKGGWTTRHYGRPDDGIHAIQMGWRSAVTWPSPPKSRMPAGHPLSTPIPRSGPCWSK